MIKEFFKEIDLSFNGKIANKLTLKIIGCAALLLQTNYSRGTKGSDILETKEITPDVESGIITLAGKGKKLHKKYGVYIDFVAEALPFIPKKPNFVDVKNLNNDLQNFRVEALEVVDVVVSKLKTFRANDIDDIRAMIDMGLVSQKILIERFRLAVDKWLIDARADDLVTYVKNLHTIQRDMLFVEETEIELPRWIGGI